MKLSAFVLSASALVTSVADALHHKVVLPALRKSSVLKAKGLDLAFQEHDEMYWAAVDDAVNAHKYAARAELNVKSADKLRECCVKAIRSHHKAKVA